MSELARLQRAFYDLVTARDREPQNMQHMFGGDPTRWTIYADSYTNRLVDVLAADFPKLCASLGEHFRRVVASYLRAYPPRSFTVRDAGCDLPRFLRDGDAPAWAADLAALERARLEAFDGPDSIPIGRDEVASLDAPSFAQLRIRWIASSAVVPVAWRVDELWSAIEDDEPWTEPSVGGRTILVWRRDSVVYHRTLDDDEANVAACLERGESIAGISAILGDAGRVVELMLRWLDAGAIRRVSA